MKKYTYGIYGKMSEWGDEDFRNAQTFTGAISEGGDVYYMNARFYDANTQRFLTQDTYKGNAWEPMSQNLYSYVGNNPVNFVDPTGHTREDDERYMYEEPNGSPANAYEERKKDELYYREKYRWLTNVDPEHIRDSLDFSQYVNKNETPRGTFGIGLFTVAQALFRGSAQYTIVGDTYGNVGLLETSGVGAGTPSVCVGAVIQTTSAVSIFDLEEEGCAGGGSAGPVIAGDMIL